MFVNILVALLVFLSSGWVVGCCSTLSIFLLFGVGEGTASFGDFFLAGALFFSFSGLSFLGCSCLSSSILFGAAFCTVGVGTGLVVGTSTGTALRTGTGTSTGAVTGTATGTGSGTSMVAAFPCW